MRKADVLDLLKGVAFDVDEQGRVGTCVSHSVRNLVRLYSRLHLPDEIDVAFADLYARRTTQHLGFDAGMFPDTAIRNVINDGIAVKGAVKGIYTLDELKQLELDIDTALYRIKPIRDFKLHTGGGYDLRDWLKNDFEKNGLRFHQLSIKSYSGWWSGEYPQATGKILGGHSIVISNTVMDDNTFVVVDSAYSGWRTWTLAKGWRFPSVDVMDKVMTGWREVDFRKKYNPLEPFAILKSATISYGDKGEHVKILQRYLISEGCKIPAGITGYFGRQTQEALRCWQRKRLFKDYGGRYWGKISQTMFKALYDNQKG